MLSRSRPLLGAVLLGLLPCSSLLAAAQDTAQRSWNQPRGNPANSSVVDVAPIRSAPEEAWRLELGQIGSSPVSWGDTLYIVGHEPRNRTLYAFSISSGDRLAKIRLGRGSDVSLAVVGGTVVVVEPEVLRTFQLRDSKLKMVRRVRGQFLDSLTVFQNRLWVGSPGGFACVDVQRGKIVSTVHGEVSLPAVAALTGGQAKFATVSVERLRGLAGRYLTLNLSSIDGADDHGAQQIHSGMIDMHADPKDSEGYAIWLGDQDGLPRWFVRSPAPLVTPGQKPGFTSALFSGDSTGALSPIVTSPAVWQGKVFGFSQQGTFIRQLGDGKYYPVVEAKDLPKGAHAGPATVAGDVAMLGNWALDLTTSRVLWCLPELSAATPLLPVADHRVVYATDGGDVVCLVDPHPRTKAVAGPAAVTSTTSRPGDGDGVILSSGRRLAGRVEISDGGVRLIPDAGSAVDLSRAEVALVEVGGAAELWGEQYPVSVAWSNAIDVDVVRLCEQYFERYLKPRLLDDCRRLLEEAQSRGLSFERGEALDAKLMGRTQSRASNAERQRKKILRAELEAREQLANGVLAASDWCRERELAGAATVLLTEGHGIHPLEGLFERAAELAPEHFPWKADEACGERWSLWAQEILPAGGRFLGPRSLDGGPEGFTSNGGAPWNADALALGTRNLVVLSMSDDPETLGACLRNGEGAIRVLEQLLGSTGEELAPLEVRLHATRADYLAERKPDGAYAMAWSAGYYSPAERISRFYVPLPDEHLDPLGRELHKTLVHELTHQYLAQRWLTTTRASGGPPSQPGYWIVEGFARFIEDQVVELGNRAASLDDPTVRSVDAAAQVAAKGGLFPLGPFVDGNHIQFMKISDEVAVEVQLRNTLRRLRLTPRSIFYEQAGSLVFFLMNRAGPERRQKLIEYMRDHYRRRTRPEGWKALGYESASELERDYHAFLAEVRG
jgi:PQQ-like domain